MPTHAKSYGIDKKVDTMKRDLSILDQIVESKTTIVPNMITAFLGFPMHMKETKAYTLREILTTKFYKNLYNTKANANCERSNFFVILWKI